MQDEKVGATRTEQIVHHATEYVHVLGRRRDAPTRAAKDALKNLLREREAALEKAVKAEC